MMTCHPAAPVTDTQRLHAAAAALAHADTIAVSDPARAALLRADADRWLRPTSVHTEHRLSILT